MNKMFVSSFMIKAEDTNTSIGFLKRFCALSATDLIISSGICNNKKGFSVNYLGKLFLWCD